MRRKLKRSTKGKVRQRLDKRLAIAVLEAMRAKRKTPRPNRRFAPDNPAHHDWIARHMERQNGRCAYCSIPMFLPPRRGKAHCRATLDHVVPIAQGGPDSEANTVAACAACNKAKGCLSESEFRSSSFCAERKKVGETMPDRPAVKLTVVVRKRR